MPGRVVMGIYYLAGAVAFIARAGRPEVVLLRVAFSCARRGRRILDTAGSTAGIIARIRRRRGLETAARSVGPITGIVVGRLRLDLADFDGVVGDFCRVVGEPFRPVDQVAVSLLPARGRRRTRRYRGARRRPRRG